MVLSKGPPGMATSTLLSGGVFAAAETEEARHGHFQRTLRAGRGINRVDLVEVLVREASERLMELVEWGIQAETYRGYLFSQGRPPIWGEEITRCLKMRADSLGVRFRGGVWITAVRCREAGVGLLGYSPIRGQWLGYLCKAAILATGGGSALYLRHDNPQRMFGEGYAVALEGGAELQDMEFVQFYPLTLAEPGLPPLLVPPRVVDRGRLRNGKGEDLLKKYGITERPAGERARDALSRAFYQEMQEGEEVWMDLTDLKEGDWREDPLSASMEGLLGDRCGAKQRPLRLAPAAHFFMGGARIDAWGRTSVSGLYAAGEVAGGVHGANRMGGNALTETLVFGARAGWAAGEHARCCENKEGKQREVREELRALIPEPRNGPGSGAIGRLKGRLRKILWEQGGLLRDGLGLSHALEVVEEIGREAETIPSGGDPRTVRDLLELGLGVKTAKLVLEGALRRKESRGSHFRTDFPKQDDRDWLGNQLVRLGQDGRLEWSFQPCRGKDAPLEEGSR
jgi:succinate dehydrogenase/fumarate reductase flavoprotein subunit